MKVHRNAGYLLFFAAVLLFLYICVHLSGDTPADAESTERGVSIDAFFRREDGGALGESTVRLSAEERSADYPLDSGGGVVVSGLPRNGRLTLTLLDHRERIQGVMDLMFSEGAVIDAATDGSGTGHITLKQDTEEIALAFLLKNDGSILCALRLEQAQSA